MLHLMSCMSPLARSRRFVRGADLRWRVEAALRLRWTFARLLVPSGKDENRLIARYGTGLGVGTVVQRHASPLSYHRCPSPLSAHASHQRKLVHPVMTGKAVRFINQGWKAEPVLTTQRPVINYYMERNPSSSSSPTQAHLCVQRSIYLCTSALSVDSHSAMHFTFSFGGYDTPFDGAPNLENLAFGRHKRVSLTLNPYCFKCVYEAPLMSGGLLNVCLALLFTSVLLQPLSMILNSIASI